MTLPNTRRTKQDICVAVILLGLGLGSLTPIAMSEPAPAKAADSVQTVAVSCDENAQPKAVNPCDPTPVGARPKRIASLIMIVGLMP